MACGNTVTHEKEITVSNVQITGFISDYVKVIDDTYTFVRDDRAAMITVKVEKINEVPPFSKLGGWVSSKLNVLDINGNVLKPRYDFELMDSDKVAELLNSNVGAVKNLTFKSDFFNVDTDVCAKIFTDAATFEWVDDIFAAQSNELPTNKQKSVSKTDSNNEWDAVLDSYESCIDKYIALYKKAQAGDMSAMSEYVSFMEKATELSEKLGNAKNDMSSAQMSRFVKLQAKLTDGLMQ